MIDLHALTVYIFNLGLVIVALSLSSRDATLFVTRKFKVIHDVMHVTTWLKLKLACHNVNGVTSRCFSFDSRHPSLNLAPKL